MKLELKKRILTSFFLLMLLTFMFFYSFILIIALIIISLITWIEFYGLISKILSKNNPLNIFLRFLLKSFTLLYLCLFSITILSIKFTYPQLEIFIYYSIFVAIGSDIGGLVVGRTIKGRRLTKISPNKTLSGAIGSFVFSLLLIPLCFNYLDNFTINSLIIITLMISLTSQLGDLFISYLKREANVKDTGDLLPGHGGFLDRLDGILFAVPIGLILFINF